MNRGRIILLLLLINLGLVVVSLYLLDMLQIIDYRQIFNQIPLIRQVYRVRIEDPYLLEKTELEKKWQILDEKTRNFNEDRKRLEEEKLSNRIERDRVEKEKEYVRNMIDNFEKMKADRATYDKRVEEVALQIRNMPPESAVKIIEKQEDMMVIDVLRKLNQLAEEEGLTSITPRLLELMDPEMSARVQRKMLESN